MNLHCKQLFVTVAVAAAVAVGPAPARAETLGEGLAARVHAIAAQGPDALRHFVWRTRMIYALDFADYAGLAAGWDEGGVLDGSWTGVTAEEPDEGAWLEAAGYPLPEAPQARD